MVGEDSDRVLRPIYSILPRLELAPSPFLFPPFPALFDCGSVLMWRSMYEVDLLEFVYVKFDSSISLVCKFDTFPPFSLSPLPHQDGEMKRTKTARWNE